MYLAEVLFLIILQTERFFGNLKTGKKLFKYKLLLGAEEFLIGNSCN